MVRMEKVNSIPKAKMNILGHTEGDFGKFISGHKVRMFRRKTAQNLCLALNHITLRMSAPINVEKQVVVRKLMS